MSTVETLNELDAGPSAEPLAFPEHRITVDRYLKMVDAGVFGRGDRVFLWHGRLVEKMTKGRPHSFATLKLGDLLGRLVPPRFHLESEQPMRSADDHLPEPDLMIVRGPLDDYRARMPTPRDVASIVEVADSTVAEDRGFVLRDYASSGIPIYWLVNIPRRRVEVYSRPTGPAEIPRYADRADYGVEAEAPLILDGVEAGRVAVREIMP